MGVVLVYLQFFHASWPFHDPMSIWFISLLSTFRSLICERFSIFVLSSHSGLSLRAHYSSNLLFARLSFAVGILMLKRCAMNYCSQCQFAGVLIRCLLLEFFFVFHFCTTQLRFSLSEFCLSCHRFLKLSLNAFNNPMDIQVGEERKRTGNREFTNLYLDQIPDT